MSRICPEISPGLGTPGRRTADKSQGGDDCSRRRRRGGCCAMARRLRWIGDGLAVLAGGRKDVLEAAPAARPRFVALGGVLLSTGALAVMSAAFAVHMALG